MKNTLLLLLLCLALSTSLFAQTDNWSFSLNIGGSWPIGEFAKNTSPDLKTGYAGRGFSLSLEADYALSENFSLKGMALLNNNPVNQYWMNSQLVNRMTQYFPIESKDQSFLSMTVNPWVYNGLLVGPMYTVSLNKILWDFQALGGLNVTYLPQEKLLYQNPANNWLYIHHNLTTVSASYGLLTGTALRFPISDKIYLRFAIDYYNTRATIKFEEIKVTNEGATARTDKLGSGNSTVPIENISSTIGFVYYLK
jgi:hypothetical protein